MTGSDEGEAAIRAWSGISQEELVAMDPDGDHVKKHLLNPVVFRLLGDVRGRRVLDAGSGQGYLSRLLASRGAKVVAVEPAETLHAYAAAKEQERPQGIEHVQADLTKIELAAEFDAVVANMVFLAIPDWTAALRTCVWEHCGQAADWCSLLSILALTTTEATTSRNEA